MLAGCTGPPWRCNKCNMDFGTRKQKYYTHMAGRHHARQVREQAGLHERKGERPTADDERHGYKLHVVAEEHH